MTTIDRDTANAILEERNDLRAALQSALGLLSECGRDYNAPNFTDRYGMGPRITARLAEGRRTLNRSDERCADCGEGADGYELRNNRCGNCQPSADDLRDMRVGV